MSEHGSEHRINKEKASPNREGAAPPARGAHIAFGHDGIEVSDARLVSGEREPEAGLGKEETTHPRD
jgi:hypothetical protein